MFVLAHAKFGFLGFYTSDRKIKVSHHVVKEAWHNVVYVEHVGPPIASRASTAAQSQSQVQDSLVLQEKEEPQKKQHDRKWGVTSMGRGVTH